MRLGAKRLRLSAHAGAALVVPALLCALPWLGAHAQGTAAPTSMTQPSPSGKPAMGTLPQAVTAEVTGFRSARFGMTTDQVREAIKRDFDIDAKDVKVLRNDLQKTEILAVPVDNLVPESGTAIVFYLFGFRSKKLIHINVVWGRQAQQNVLPATLVNTGRILQQYFLGQGFSKEGMAVNQAANNGQIVLFQGHDEKLRAVHLVLEMSPVVAEKTAESKTTPAKPGAKETQLAKPADKTKGSQAQSPQLIATSLRLSYIENVANPDIYSIKKGKF